MSARETVERLISAEVEQDFATVLELLAEHSFSQRDSGRIYIGHRGVSDWIRDFARHYTSSDFVVHSIRELDDSHYVLVTGLQHRTTVRGEAEAVPGAWLYHVADGRVTAVVYFRTEADALRSLSGPGRGERPYEVVQFILDAYNRRDLASILALIHPDIRFTQHLTGEMHSLEGIDALARHLASIDDHYPGVLFETYHLTEIGHDFVLVETLLRVDADAERFSAVFLARVERGKLSEFVLHEDVEAARFAATVRI